ncbi:hypothetical protein [Selenomonas ruminantium]|uniref:Uncharacterized protein n=1 Tax=Selenomonas ruminantium TaxID=971 RepID=A0A1I0YDM0_SELRU|nr:hypothetical protein [Selenomonas ruminantium]SFB10458.1 hypothetical protein SAMN05216587_11168 [Selenomonas ruminantium]
MTSFDSGFVSGILIGLGAILSLSSIPTGADEFSVMFFCGVLCLQVLSMAACVIDLYMRTKD